MKRKSPGRLGVYQRCGPLCKRCVDGCPDCRQEGCERCAPGYVGSDRCSTDRCKVHVCKVHKWGYSVELARPQGRDQLSKGGYKSAKAAADARAELVRQHREGMLPADRAKTLGEWLPEWLADKIERGELERSTARTYRDHIRDYLVPKLGHRKLGELRGLEITRAYRDIVKERQALIVEAQARNIVYAEQAALINEKRAAAGKRLSAVKRHGVPRALSPATIARIHAVLSGALKSATKAGLVPRNVAGDAELPKVERKKVRPPTPEAYGGLLDAIVGERLYVLILVAGHSGMRRGELAGMKWADIDLKTGRWVLGLQRTSVNYEVEEKSAKTEAGDERVTYLDAGTLAELRTWKAQQNAEKLAWGEAWQDGGYVFTKENGEPLHPDAITKTVGRLMRRAGLTTAKLHALRHFRAAALISTGADIAAVSKAMGHSSISVTSDIYGSLFEKASQEMSENAAAIVPRHCATCRTQLDREGKCATCRPSSGRAAA